MAITTAPTVTAMEAQAIAFEFLNDRLPDRIIPDAPSLRADCQEWQVAVVLSYPRLGVLGQVGQITVSATTGEVLAFTPVEEIRAAALSLAERHRDAIQAPVS
jgi:hypothetical protein